MISANMSPGISSSIVEIIIIMVFALYLFGLPRAFEVACRPCLKLASEASVSDAGKKFEYWYQRQNTTSNMTPVVNIRTHKILQGDI